MHDTTYLFHGIVEMIATKLILILMIDTNCMCKLRNDIN